MSPKRNCLKFWQKHMCNNREQESTSRCKLSSSNKFPVILYDNFWIIEDKISHAPYWWKPFWTAQKSVLIPYMYMYSQLLFLSPWQYTQCTMLDVHENKFAKKCPRISMRILYSWIRFCFQIKYLEINFKFMDPYFISTIIKVHTSLIRRKKKLLAKYQIKL